MGALLIVEDDETIGDVLRARLESEGHGVTWVRDGAAALAHPGPVDLVLLDLGLPDLDGTEVCRRLRAARPDAVVVVLTARDSEMDVVAGLESGADDYLSKPVRSVELAARVRAHLRRAEPAPRPRRLQVGTLAVDARARRASVDGRELVLRAKEFDLLARLAAEPGAVVRRETLMSDVWDEHWDGSTKTLDVHVAVLRRKLAEHAGPTAPVIATVRGHGYRLEPHPRRPPDADARVG